jgi:hypothetical protein
MMQPSMQSKAAAAAAWQSCNSTLATESIHVSLLASTASCPPPWLNAEPLPKVIHYGLTWNVSTAMNYTFNKHWNFKFDMLACPPWEMG